MWTRVSYNEKGRDSSILKTTGSWLSQQLPGILCFLDFMPYEIDSQNNSFSGNNLITQEN